MSQDRTTALQPEQQSEMPSKKKKSDLRYVGVSSGNSLWGKPSAMPWVALGKGPHGKKDISGQQVVRSQGPTAAMWVSLEGNPSSGALR